MLSENIRKCRKSKQMSQDELAEKLGVTRQSISLWETGQTQPSLDNIIALAELFDISTDALLTDKHPEAFCAEAAEAKTGKPKKKIMVAICLAAVSVIVIAALLLGRGGGNEKGNPDTPTGDGVVSASTSQQLNENESPKTGAAGTKDNGDSSSGVVSKNTESKENEPPKTNEERPQDNSGGGQDTAPGNAEGAAGNDAAEKDLYSYLKNFVVQKGTVSGDYCYYSKTADHYGGYSSEDFSLYYWGDTKTVEFCLHSVLSDTFSINFYLYVPQQHTGEYEYVSSYYYRDNGEPLYEARGVIAAEEFTKTYPLNCDKYIGSTEIQDEFMEMSRQGVCDLIACLEKFIEVEQLEYSFADFGFGNFN